VRDWEPVTTGHSGALVHRSPDGRRFAKTAAPLAELTAERDRLLWLSTMPVAAPEVLDWAERDGNGTLITSTLHGIPASALSPAEAPVAAGRLVEFLGLLHGLPVRDCPFDRRLAVTVPSAAANVTAGLVDQDDFDDVRRGRTAGGLLDQLRAGRPRAEALQRADLAICHGDFCLPNVLLDPDTLAVTGILDVGRLGVADRHVDVALLTRSVAATDLNPSYGPELAALVADRTGADPWRIEYYRLLDEFF
jgi:kanamycin kinase/streptomycin 3"-kinase/aminoglycoside 3'-phosphotransferase-2